MAELFTCSNCGGEFEKAWTDEEAAAEKEDKFPDASYDEMTLVCGDCYDELMEENYGKT